jgi:hypothetical protein
MQGPEFVRSGLARIAPCLAEKNGLRGAIDGILFAGWEGEYKYSFTSIPISTLAPSLTLVLQAKDAFPPCLS